jgi:hypothetical protein
MGDLAVIGSLAACHHPASSSLPSGTQRYKLISVVFAPYGASWDPKTAFDKQLTIGPRDIEYGKDSCKVASPKTRTVNADDYFQDFGMSKDHLGISAESVTVVRTGCPGELGEYVLTDKEVILIWDGVAYQLQRQN